MITGEISNKTWLTGLSAARSKNFRTISGHFCRFHEAQETEEAHFYVLINVTH